MLESDLAAERFHDAMNAELGVPPVYRGMSLDTFLEPGSWAVGRLRKWLDAPDKPGIYLHGPTGRGKTALALAILLRLVERDGAAEGYTSSPGKRGAFATVPGMFDRLKSFEDGGETREMIRLQNVRYLALDDLGVERMTVCSKSSTTAIPTSCRWSLRPTWGRMTDGPHQPAGWTPERNSARQPAHGVVRRHRVQRQHPRLESAMTSTHHESGFGTVLYQLRASLGISQADLARATDLTGGYLSRLEGDRKSVV